MAIRLRIAIFGAVPTKGIEPSHPYEWQILSVFYFLIYFTTL